MDKLLSTTPYGTHMSFSWWVILTIVLACVGTFALTTYLVINHMKSKKNKKDSD